MSTDAMTLYIVARARACEGLLTSSPGDSALDTVAACDHGLEFDKALMRINVARRDPWFARAAEAAGGAQFSVDRPLVYAKLLQLFALTEIELIQRKLLPRQAWERVVLEVAGPAQGTAEREVFSADELSDASGREALQRIRCQFISGNGPGLLAANNHRIGLLLKRARERH